MSTVTQPVEAVAQAREDKVVVLRHQLEGMKEKARRLAQAITDRQQALNRLEASAVLGTALPARRRHE